jgi:hypothetical protein
MLTCINRMSERETVVELPFAADCCPCVGECGVAMGVWVRSSEEHHETIGLPPPRKQTQGKTGS